MAHAVKTWPCKYTVRPQLSGFDPHSGHVLFGDFFKPGPPSPPPPRNEREDFFRIVLSSSSKYRNISKYASNFASLFFRQKCQSWGKLVKNVVRVLVSHRQLLGFYNISIFNFVAFSLSGKLFSLSDHYTLLFGFSAWSFFIFSFSGTRSSF